MGRTILAFVLVFVFLVLVFVVVGLLNVFSKPVVVQEQNLSEEFVPSYRFLLSSNVAGFEDAGFDVSFNGSFLVQGLMKMGAIEEFKQGVKANSTIVFRAWSDSYYSSIRNCTVSQEGYICSVNLSKKALYYNISLDTSYLGLVLDGEGLIRKPVICFGWGSSVADVRLSLPIAPKVAGFERLVDVCYDAGDVNLTTYYPLDFRRNEFYTGTPTSLSVFVFDTDGLESVGAKPIGSKNLTIIV
jgi:hypothetical protein